MEAQRKQLEIQKQEEEAMLKQQQQQELLHQQQQQYYYQQQYIQQQMLLQDQHGSYYTPIDQEVICISILILTMLFTIYIIYML